MTENEPDHDPTSGPNPTEYDQSIVGTDFDGDQPIGDALEQTCADIHDIFNFSEHILRQVRTVNSDIETLWSDTIDAETAYHSGVLDEEALEQRLNRLRTEANERENELLQFWTGPTSDVEI